MQRQERRTSLLTGADEGEVHGIEEEDDIFALVVIQRDRLEFAVHQRRGLEGRSFYTDSGSWAKYFLSKAIRMYIQ